MIYICPYMNNEKRSSLLILAACFLWALDILVRYPITLQVNFIHIVFIESLLGLLFVTPWLIKHGRHELKSFSMKDWLLAIFLGGFGMTVAGFLSTESILEASPGTFSFFQIFQPLFVVYAAHVFLKEKIDTLYFYWGLWVVLSAMLMYSQDLEMLMGNDISIVPGAMLIAFATMLIWGLCTIAGKKLLISHRPFTLVAVRWLFAFIFSLGFISFDKTPIPWDQMMNWDLIWRFGFISAVAGTASMYLYFTGMRDLPAAKVSFLELCYPALGIMFSALYTYEKVSFLQAIGVVSFFAFVLLILGRKESPGELTRRFP
ncbi:MAG TPA: DMT family transporter [Bacteriovoracaceae bacterium]|nr:DMT family transporter [Bacteriovoracaceae bacterium]